MLMRLIYFWTLTHYQSYCSRNIYTMKRTSQRTCRKTAIIEISSSEDEDEKVFSDHNYEPDEKKKKTKMASTETGTNNKRRKTSTTSVSDKRKKIIKPKTETVKLENDDTDNDEETNRKKQKVQAANSKNEIKTIQDIDKENLKNMLKSTHDLNSNSMQCQTWTEVDYIIETNNVSKHVAENVIELFKEENTIPFIARYRKNMTGGMEPDELRALKDSFDEAKLIKQKAATIIKSIDKLGQWTPNIHSAITAAKCMDDLEHIYSIFKPASKKSLAERAKIAGLGPISDNVLQGQTLPDLSSLIDSNKEGKKSEEQIREGIIQIIADTINKDKFIFDKVKELQVKTIIKIQTTQCKTNKASENKEKDVNRKYEMYYDFTSSTKTIRPHQILAINRGESQKILNVKIILPDFFLNQFREHCSERYKQAMLASKLHAKIMYDSVEYAYSKFIKPLVVRRVRNEMKQKAETASIEVFVANVKQLLLTPPVRGKIILGIDPGFSHGCKLAVISEHGNVLETSTIYPHKHNEKSYVESAKNLVYLVKKYKCTILALGNATACRETEAFLNKLLKSKAFDAIDISYTIVDEAGASIYSCSSEAKSEFPNLDINVVSAVSIARRLQDPLAELVKVEPKHLGVGMYQHDLPEKQLSTALNEVVSEVVSFVGVDINTASLCLLIRVAGLNTSRANSIIEWRAEFGPFKNRQQLLDVKGIGLKTFEQCAGFIRILPETSAASNKFKSKDSKKKNSTPNLLDQTWIHPESYNTAGKFLDYCNCKLEDLGTTSFIEQIKTCANAGLSVLAKRFDTDETTMEVIVKGLSMKKDEDIRLKSNHPLFRNTMLSINDISSGTELTGAVRNITHFGAFVDVGVGRDGLIPIKYMNNCSLSIGQRVEVTVLTVDISRNRIGLKLNKIV